MELEPEKPSHGAFATPGYAFENPVVVNPFIVTYFQRSGIDIRYSGTLPKKHFFDEYSKMKQYWFLQLYKTVIGDNIGEKMPQIYTYSL